MMTDEDSSPDPGSLAVAVVTRVAEAEGTAPTELPPLGRTVDLDSLEGLFRRSSTSLHVRFVYLGRTIEIGPDGTVRLDPADE